MMSLLTLPFWNRAEQRLRAGWRVGLQLAVWIYLPVILNRRLSTPLARSLGELAPSGVNFFALTTHFLVSAVGIVSATWLIVRYVDRRPFSDLGLQSTRIWWEDLAFGVALGGLLMTAIFVVEQMLGWVEIVGVLPASTVELPWLAGLLIPLIAFVVISLTEELLSSSYQVRNLAEGLNLRWLTPQIAILLAWIISSVIFAWLHIPNPNSSLASTINLFMLGLFFGLGYLLTGSLAIPLGLHFSWNFFQGTIFGFPVSGRDFGGVVFLNIRQSGPVAWTGGAFGPEAGLIGLLGMLVGAGLSAWWIYKRTGHLGLYLPLSRYCPPTSAPDPPNRIDLNLSHTQE